MCHVAYLDLPGFDPPPDKSCGGDELVAPRGVIADQPPGQGALVQQGD